MFSFFSYSSHSMPYKFIVYLFNCLFKNKYSPLFVFRVFIVFQTDFRLFSRLICVSLDFQFSSKSPPIQENAHVIQRAWAPLFSFIHFVWLFKNISKFIYQFARAQVPNTYELLKNYSFPYFFSFSFAVALFSHFLCTSLCAYVMCYLLSSFEFTLRDFFYSK